MGRTIERLPAGLAIVAVLAVAQGLVGLLRAMEWIGVGSDLLGRGMLLVPILGALAFLRGFMVAGIALLYAAFAWGAFAGHGWAWWVGLGAALLNALLVLTAVAEGGPLLQALLWTIVPAVVVVYLLTPGGRQALPR
jgi:hypothetical protein